MNRFKMGGIEDLIRVIVEGSEACDCNTCEHYDECESSSKKEKANKSEKTHTEGKIKSPTSILEDIIKESLPKERHKELDVLKELSEINTKVKDIVTRTLITENNTDGAKKLSDLNDELNAVIAKYSVKKFEDKKEAAKYTEHAIYPAIYQVLELLRGLSMNEIINLFKDKSAYEHFSNIFIQTKITEYLHPLYEDIFKMIYRLQVPYIVNALYSPLDSENKLVKQLHNELINM